MSPKKPSFFIVGAPRSGTTALYEFLRAHPGVYMPIHKEPHFFATDISPRNRWMKAFRVKRNYLKLFDQAKENQISGEASVLYLLSTVAAKKIKKFNPNAKIIIMLRSPLEVMYSLYYQLHYGGDEPAESFAEALALESMRRRGKKVPKTLRMKNFYYYRKVANFSTQVKKYLDIFPKQQMKVIIYEDFRKDPVKVYKSVLRFLNVDTNFNPEIRNVNANRAHRNIFLQQAMNKFAIYLSKFGFDLYIFLRPVYKLVEGLNLVEKDRPKMDPLLEVKLKKEFLPEVKKLSKLINYDVTYWCK